MYRVLHRLDVGKGRILWPGSHSRLEWLDEVGLARLETKGAISRVHAPPLEVLPGWADRALVLANIGIADAEQFLEANDSAIMEALEEDGDGVRVLRDELLGWLTVGPPSRG